MATTYEDKRAELRALAEGGSAGRDAYKAGRQRLVSDQRAAIDAALSGPVRFGEGTAAALESIVRPVGDTATARMDFAADSHDTSMGALDAALGGALAQQGGARALNYDQTLSRSQQSTDRQIEAGEIQRRKAAERAAAAEAERAARETAARPDYSQSEQKAAAEALGAMLSDEDAAALREMNKAAKVEDLLKVIGSAFGDLDPILQGGLMDQVWANMDNPEAIAALVQEYSPVHSEAARRAVQAVAEASNPQAPRRVDRPGGPTVVPPVPASRQRALDNILAQYSDVTLPTTQQAERVQETQRHLYNQDAYTQLFGDPLLAAGLFPADFGEVSGELDDQSALEDYIRSGMRGEELERYEADEMAGFEAQIASAAGLTPGAVNKIAGKSDLDAVGIYETLSDPEVAAVVSLAVETAMERYQEEPLDGRKRPSRAEITRDIVLDVTEALPDYVDSEYRQALAAIAREQFSYLYGG